MIGVSATPRRLLAALVVVFSTTSLTTCRLDELLRPGEFGRLVITPLELVDSARVGSRATRTTSAELSIEGAGSQLRFSVLASGNSPWIALSSPTGAAPGTYSLTLDPAGLAEGEHLDTLRFTSEGPEAPQLLIPLRFRVLPCEVTDIATIPATIADTLTDADCGSLQQPDRFAQRFRFAGTANDSVTVQVSAPGFQASVALEREGTATPVAQSESCAVVGSGACVRYVRLPDTGDYVIEVTSAAARATGAFSLVVGRPRPPALPLGLGQRSADGAALPVAVGGTIASRSIVVEATLADPDLDSLRLELEHRPSAVEFTGVATLTTALGRGPQFAQTVTSLLDDTNYHWQVRAVDATGRTSAWAPFGASAGVIDFAVAVPEPPGPPTALVQRRSDGVGAIGDGGTTNETLIRLGATLTDPDPGDQVRLDVEVRPVGTAFTGVATASSPPAPSGSFVLATVLGLLDDVAYRWQARTVDQTGQVSAWVPLSATGANFRTAVTPTRLAVTVEPTVTAAGAAITPSVRIAAQDAAGATLTSFTGAVTIALGVNPSGATLGGTRTVTAVQGVATFTDLSLDRTGAGYTLVATSGAFSATTAPFSVTSAAPAALGIDGVPATLVAGNVITPPVLVTVRDGLGNVATSFTGSVTLALATNGAGAVLLGTTSVDAVAGVATFANLRVQRVATGLTLVAIATGLPNATSTAFAVTPAAPATARFVTPPAGTGASGIALTQQPVVVIEDAFANAVTTAGTTVTATITGGPSGGALTNATATTSALGVATFSGLAISGPSGSYTLAFGVTGLPTLTSGAITLSAGSAARLGLATPPSPTAANGVVFSGQPVVQVQDGAGNPVAQAGVTVTVAIASGGGTLGGTTSIVSSATGAAIFTDLRITGGVGPRTLAFASTGLTGVTSGTITVTSGTATQLVLQAGGGQTAVAGTLVGTAPSVVARDASGNPVAGVPVTFAVTGGGGVVVPTTPVATAASGIAASTSWRLGTVAGANTLTASSPGLTGSPVAFAATGVAGPSTQLTIVLGDNLTGPVGTTLGTRQEVRIADVNGNPVAGVNVTWTVAGGGSVNPTSSVTDANGLASTERTLGGTPGTQTLTAGATLSTGPATVVFTATATVGGATQMALSSGDLQADTVGATLAIPLAVVVRDGLSNPVPGVLITWSAFDGGGSVSPATSATNAQGIATTSWTLGTTTTPTDSTQSARATGVASPVTFTATSRPGAVSGAQTLVSVAPATVAASRGAPATVTVTARDGFGNVIPGRTVTLTAATSTVVQPVAATNASGITTGAVGAPVAGARTIIATVNGIVAAQQPTLNVVAAPATRLAYTIAPSDVVAGASITPAPALEALDSLGNRNLTFADPVSIAIGTDPGTGTLSGALTRNAIAGLVSFPGLSINRTGTGYTLVGSATGLTSATSVPFTVSVGGVSASASLVTATTPITAGGTGSTITITARDANANPIAGLAASFAVSGTGNAITQPAGVTNASGVITGSFTSTIAQTKTVTVTVGGTTVLATQPTVTVNAGAVSTTLSTVTVAPASIVAGGSGSLVTVTVRNTNNVPIVGATVVLAATGTGHTFTTPAVTDANGVTTATMTSTVAGAKTVSAAVGAVTIAQQPTVTVTAGTVSPTNSTVTVSPASIEAGGPGSTVTVTVRNTNNVPVVGATVVLVATGTGNALTLPAVTNASGVTTATLTSTDVGVKALTASVGAVTITQQPTVTVAAGTVSATNSSIAVSPASIEAGGAGSLVTVTVRNTHNVPVVGATVVLAATGTGNSLTAPAVTDASGVTTATLTSTVAEVKTVSASVGVVAITPSATVTVTAGAVSAANSTVTVSPASIVAGGTGSLVTVTVRNTNNVPVVGATVVLAATGGGNSFTTPAVTNASGVTTATLTSTVAGVKTVSAAVGAVTVTQQPTVTVTAGTVSPTNSTVTVSPASIVAGGTGSLVTVTVRNTNNVPVVGATVVLAATGNGNSFTAPAVTNASGVTTATLTSSVAEVKTVSAAVGAVTITQQPPVTVTAGTVSATNSTVTVAPASIEAGGAGSVITITVRNTNNVPVVGATVVLAATGSDNSLTSPPVTNASGVTTATLSSTVAEVKTISASVGAVAITSSPTVTVTAGVVSPTNSTIAVSPASIEAGGAGSTVTVTVRNTNNVPVVGAAVVLAATGTGNSFTAPAVTDAAGVTTATFTSTVAESKTLTATVGAVTITPSPTVTVTAGTVSATNSTVAVAPASIEAGGTGSLVTVTVRNTNNVPVVGATVVVSATGTGNTLTAPAITDANGATTVTLTSTVAEVKTVSAAVGAVTITATPTVTVTAGTVSPTNSTVTVAPASIVAAGTGSVVTVTVRNTHNVPIVGATVVYASTGTANTFTTPAVTNASGVTTATLTSTMAEVKTVSAAVGAVTITQQPTVTVVAGAVSPSLSTVAATSPVVVGGSTSGITVTARDANNNPIVGATVILSATGTGNTITQPAVTNASGVATGTLSSTVAADKVVSATINAGAGPVAPSTTPTVTFTPGAASQLAVQAGNAQSAIAGSTVTVPPAVIARDAFNNPVAGVAVTFAVTSGAGLVVPTTPVLTLANGIATATSWQLGTTAGANGLGASAAGLTGSPVAFTATGLSGPSTQLTIAAGNNLSGQVGGTLATAHEVRVADANGNPVSGVTINWAAVGGGSVNPTSSVTDASGIAATSRTLGPTPGAQSTTAGATLSTGPASVTFTATALVGGPTQMALSAGDAQVDTVGATLPTPLAVLVRDALNNPVAGVLISWTVPDGGGSVSPTTSLTNASGIATTSWTLGTLTSATDSTQNARASGVASPVNFIATTRPGAVSASQSTVTATTPIAAGGAASTITVTARDGFGNPIAGATVALAASGTGTSLTQPVGVTNANGVATGTLSATLVGTKVVSATINAGAGAVAIAQTAPVTVVPGPVSASNSLVTASGPLTAGGAGSTVTITARDANGNVIPGLVASFAVSGTGNVLTQPSLVTNASGVTTGSFTSTVAGTKTVTVTVDGSTVLTTQPTVTVNAGAVSPAFSTVAVSPASIEAGGPGSLVTVTVRNINNVPIVGATVVFAATGTGNSFTTPAVTDAAGVTTATLTSTVAAVKTVSASVGAVTITQQPTVTVTAGTVSPTNTTVSVSPASIEAGGTGSVVTVTVRNTHNVPVAGATVVLASSGTGNTLTAPAVTNASGVTTATLTSTIAEAKTISATVGAVPITQQPTVTVTPGTFSPTLSTVVAAPGTITAGGAGSVVTATVRNTNGVAIIGATVVFASSGTGNSFTAAAVTNASGVTTATLTSTVAESKTVSASVGAVPITPSATVAVNPGPVSASASLATATGPITAGGAGSTVSITVRDANNNPIAGVAASFTVSGTGNALTQPVGVTNAAGLITGSFTSTVAESKTVTVTVGGATVLTAQPSVTVNPGVPAAGTSSVTVSPATITAGGTGSLVTVTVRDANSNPVPGATVVLAATGTGNSFTAAAVTNASGVTTATLTSTGAGTKVVSASVGAVTFTQQPTVTVVPGAVSATMSTATATSPITAGGAASTVTITARDAFSNPIAGLAASFTVSGTGNTPTQPAGVTNASGVITGSFTSTVAEGKTVTVTISGATVLAAQPAVTVNPGPLSAGNSLVTATTPITAGGTGSTVTITARDASGNPIAGLAASFTVGGTGNALTQPVGVTNASGVITGSFTSTTAESKTVTATVGVTALTTQPAVLVNPGPVAALQSSVTVSPASIEAGGPGSLVTVTVRDVNLNPISGATVVLAATGTGNSFTVPALTNASGVTTATLSSTAAGVKTVSASVGAVTISQQPTVTVVQGAVSASQSLASATSPIIAGGTGSTITVTARNQYGIPVAGVAASFTVSGTGNVLTQPASVTDAAGVITGSFTSTVAQVKTVTVTAGGTVLGTQPAVTVNPAAVSAGNSLVTASSPITAGGAASTITITVRDVHGNPIPGRAATFTVGGTGNVISQPAGVTDASGVITGSFTSTVAQAKAIVVTIDGTTVLTTQPTVTVNPGAVSAASSLLTVSPASIEAGGTGSLLTATVRDGSGNAISGATVVFAATGTGNSITIPAVTNASGVTTATLTSTVAEAKTVTATVGATTFTAQPTVTVTAGTVSPTNSTVTVSPASIEAGGSGSLVTVTVRNTNNVPIVGATVAFAATGTGHAYTTPAVTNASGVTTATLTSTVAGVKTVSAAVGAVTITQQPTVTITAGTVSATNSTVTVSPASIEAGGAGSLVTVTVRNTNNVPVVGATVVFAATGTGHSYTTPLVTDASGMTSATLTSTVAAVKTVSASVGAVTITQQPTVTVTAGTVSAANSSVTVSPASITAGGAGSLVTVTVRNTNNVAIVGATVTFAATGTGNSFTAAAVTNAAGITTATLTSTVAETKTVSASVGVTTITQQPTVTVVPGAVNAGASTVVAAPASITAVTGTSTITVTARDVHGNPIAGAAVVLAASGTGNTLTQPAALTDANGQATGTLSSTIAEAKTVSATVGVTGITQTATVTVTVLSGESDLALARGRAPRLRAARALPTLSGVTRTPVPAVTVVGSGGP